MANEISKIKLPGGTTEYTVKDNSAITNITRSGTTFTATKRDGTEFTFTQQDNNTTYTFATGDNDGQIKVTPSGGTAQNVSVKGLGAAAYKGTTTSVTSGSSDLVTSGAVYTAIDNLPEPMIFKGSLGTGGTITTLPTASSANEGFTYKVITTGTYASQAAKVGDLFISNGTDWIWIPSGDEPSGTVTSVAAGTGLDGGTITTSGTLSVKYGTAAGTACQGNDSRLSDARTPTSHTHGNIQNGGTLQTNDITIANGDKLVVTDSSDSAKVARTSISFDGSTATKALTQKGTWETFGTSNLAIGTTATTALAGNTKYAGASTAGGSATSAAKLDTATAGSAIQPCYFANGIPSACTYTLGKSVPSTAEFTDTTYTLSADTTHYKIKLTPSNGTAQSITVPYATISSQVGQISIGHSTKPMYLDAGVPKECTYTLGKSVPSNAVFTDTNNAVTQTDVTTSMDLRVLLSKSANDTTETDYVRKSSNLTFNPSTGTLTSTNFVGSLTGAASKLGTSDKGSATQPIYLVLGVPYACTYTLEKSVPSDAVFTDHYAWTDITGKPSSFTPASHTHGNIQNGGTLQTNDITIASGDKLVVTDSSDSSKVARTSISFDGSTTTKCLTQKGTWATFGTSNLTLGTTASTALKGDTKYAGASTAGGSATSAAKLDTSTAGSATKPCYFVNGVPSACTYSLNKTVPSDAVFTDTNNAVTQTATTTSANYELLFSATADNTTRTEGARKTDSLKYNPSTKELTLDGTIVLNGYSRTTSTDPCPSLILKAKNIDTDTAVSARTYSNSEINVHDKDGDRLGFMNWFKDTDGSIGFALSAQNKSTGGTSYYNTLEMRVDKTGNRAYSISDAKAFRTAINTTTCSFTKSISSLAGATIVRRGNVVTLEFGHQITKAGSYTNIGTVSPAPIETLHFTVVCGNSWQLARINTAGVVSFNNALSVAANSYLIGSCTYITAD